MQEPKGIWDITEQIQGSKQAKDTPPFAFGVSRYILFRWWG
jgi:hypothetical protein